jgi:hypothetical protein
MQSAFRQKKQGLPRPGTWSASRGGGRNADSFLRIFTAFGIKGSINHVKPSFIPRKTQSGHEESISKKQRGRFCLQGMQDEF